jgi:predicted HicB family RNase H-like nuclease
MMETKTFKNGKRRARKNDKKIDFRLSQERSRAITVEAASKHCSVGDVLRTAAENHLLKEIDDANLIIEHLPKIMRKQERLQESVELLSELFIFWLRYFFAYAPSFSSEEDRIRQTKIGEIVKDRMLEHFKKYKMENKKSWFEQLIMEYFEFGSSEGGTIG